MHPSLSAPVSASTSPLTPTPLPAARQSPGHSPAKSEPAGECRNVYLETIRLDEGSQARARIRPGLVRDYAAAMRQQLAEGGLRFPPVVLFHEERKCYWIGDGFHRVAAAQRAGQGSILAEVYPGKQRDALLYAITANSQHGLPRTKADKRKAVTLLLTDAEWKRWSDREIARRCQVSQSFVTTLRRSLSDLQDQMRPRKVRRGHQVYEMQARQTSHPGPSTPGEAERPAGPAATAGAEPSSDGLGLPVPAPLADVFASVADFRAAKELYDQLADLIDRLARQPGGAVLRPHLCRKAENGQERFVCAELEASCQKVLAAVPYCSSCPLCYLAHPGFNHPDCKLCRGQGWTTQARFQSCPENYRQQMLQAHGVRQFELVA